MVPAAVVTIRSEAVPELPIAPRAMSPVPPVVLISFSPAVPSKENAPMLVVAEMSPLAAERSTSWATATVCRLSKVNEVPAARF